MKLVSISPYKPISGQDFTGEKILLIDAAAFRNLPFQDGQTAFVFIECNFQKLIIKNTHAIEFEDISIRFVDCYIDDLEVSEIASDNISLYFSSSLVAGKINSSRLRSVELNNCLLRSGLFLENIRTVHISYTEENIFPLRWRRMLTRLRVDLESLLSLTNSYHLINVQSLLFRTNEQPSRKPGVYKTLYGGQRENRIRYALNEAEKNKLNLNLSVKYSKSMEGQKIDVQNSYLESISLSGSCNGDISVENTRINDLYLYDFTPKGEMGFYNVRPRSKAKEPKIGIHKCNLDTASFDNVDFDKYERISLYRSKLANATFTSCSFPESYKSFASFMPIENVHYPHDKSDNYAKDQYEMFLQLKSSLEGTGNYYESQKLQAIAHDALKQVTSISLTDRLILKINSLSNNHGLSILSPFIWFLGLSILFYILYLYSLGRIFNRNEIDWTLFGYYFSFVDITHRTDFLVDKRELNGCSLAIDYFNKVIVGFLIYQFIAAFRKYGKN